MMSFRRLKQRGLGRTELLQWLNQVCEMDYTKVRKGAINQPLRKDSVEFRSSMVYWHLD